MTETRATEAANWTIAYRKPRANRFLRVTNWSGTWREANEMAGKFAALHPELQVWYTSTRAAEDTNYVQAEDKGTIMVESGRRVRVVDAGVLDEELIPAPAEDVEPLTVYLDVVSSGTVLATSKGGNWSGQAWKAGSGWLVLEGESGRDIGWTKEIKGIAVVLANYYGTKRPLNPIVDVEK